jgi:solute carrier family 25 citrate transporter 1
VTASLGPFGTARRIVQREGPLALYKGLTAVYTGIVPKMAIRFVSFEYYRDVLGGWHAAYYRPPPAATNGSDADGGGGTGGGGGGAAGRQHPESVTFLAGLLSGLTEAVLVVTPAEVCKIRMQSQYHSMMDPAQRAHAKYKNVAQTAMLVAREEGFGALYKGVVPTMLRQGCNQAVNFTAYNWSKGRLLEYKSGASGGAEATLDHWQTLLLGGLSGGMGPLANNPLDVVKTRMQKQVITPGREPKYNGLLNSCIVIGREEGVRALWRGITPRLMRIMPGQAITFMTYEAVTVRIERYGLFD